MRNIMFLLALILLPIQVTAYGFGQNKVQRAHLQWSKIETLHFDIYYNKGDDDFGQTAALMAEEAYYFIKEDLKTPVSSRIPIIFYKSHQDFETTNIIYPLLNESVGGFTELSKNRIAIPFDGSYKEMEETLIHELTHAYINEMNKSRSRFINISGLPFWFSEGFPEFISVGGQDVYNNMFVIDLLMNDGLINLDQVGGYFAYRLGESFLVYIGEEYGRQYVFDLFYALRISNSIDNAFQSVFGLDFEKMQLRWKNFLKRRYLPYIAEFDIPYEVYEQKTYHQKDGSYLNYAPRFSPDGDIYLYFSNKDIRSDIWKANTLELKSPVKIVRGESSSRFEEFHFQKNNISWFPDGQRFAFVSKTSRGDRIYVMNYQTGQIIYEFNFPDFDAVFEIDISPDGEEIVFSGQKDLQNDIYIFTIANDRIRSLTNDIYNDSQPRWSRDGSRIVFTSERSIYPDSTRQNLFNELNNDIFFYDLATGNFYQVTDDPFSNQFPLWDSSGHKILFVSERTFATNFEIIDINSGERAIVTRSLGGKFTGDLDKNDENLIFSCYYNGGWDLYQKSYPLRDLEYYAYHQPYPVWLSPEYKEQIGWDRLQFYGRKEKKIPPTPGNPARGRKTNTQSGEIVWQDSTHTPPVEELDPRPREINPPRITPYQTRFTLDYLWGGMAYSPSGGTYAQLQMGLSDLMGNHGIGINVGISGEIDNSNLLVNYLYLARRVDYGIGAFYLNDEIIYRITYSDPSQEVDYFREREREYGFYLITRYPFSKFWRVDMENLFYRNELRRDWWNNLTEKWQEEYLPQEIQDNLGLKEKEEEFIWAPQISLVHDNSIFGAVGPVSGWRGTIILSRSFSTKNSYSVIYSDLRKYFFFEKRFSYALRLFGGTIMGDTNSRFYLDYFNGVRGFDDDKLKGKNKAVLSSELRFPFIDNLKMAFPLPLWLYSIRGSIYADIGAVWNDNSDFQPLHNDRFKDLIMGFGFGPRINLTYFVLKFDVAWHTDLIQISKPSFYLSLSPDF